MGQESASVRGVRREVRVLAALGRLPSETGADPEVVDTYQAALERITPPLSVEEARVLVDVFGEDDCFGLAWSLLHLIESAGQPVVDEEPPASDQWRRELWERWVAAQRQKPEDETPDG